MTYYLNVYDVGDAYGGSEEGGWWFKVGEFLECVGTASSLSKAKDQRDQFEKRVTEYRMGYGEHDGVDANGDGDDSCMLLGGRWGDGELSVFIEEHVGKDFPTERPHYEQEI